MGNKSSRKSIHDFEEGVTAKFYTSQTEQLPDCQYPDHQFSDSDNSVAEVAILAQVESAYRINRLYRWAKSINQQSELYRNHQAVIDQLVQVFSEVEESTGISEPASEKAPWLVSLERWADGIKIKNYLSEVTSSSHHNTLVNLRDDNTVSVTFLVDITMNSVHEIIPWLTKEFSKIIQRCQQLLERTGLGYQIKLKLVGHNDLVNWVNDYLYLLSHRLHLNPDQEVPYQPLVQIYNDSH